MGDIQDFYGLSGGGGEADPFLSDLKKDDTSYLFFFSEGGGTEDLSLGVMHGPDTDLDPSSSYGNATFQFSGIDNFNQYSEPADGGVRDDTEANGDTWEPSSTVWKWAAGFTDGGAWKGGIGQDDVLTIEASFDGETDRWVLVQSTSNGELEEVATLGSGLDQ